MSGYSDLLHILVSTLMNSIQALLVLFLFSFLALKQKLFLRYISYSLFLGVIGSFIEWLFSILSPAGMAISTIITALIYLAGFKYIYKFKHLKCIISLLVSMILFIISSLASATILSAFEVKSVFTNIGQYAIACSLTFALYVIQLLIIHFFSLLSKFPSSVRNGLYISNIAFLIVTILIITCNMNYYMFMYKTENKLIFIANCAVFLYLFYANINSNIGLLKYKKLMEQHMDTVAELVVVNERNRFARDAHDTIGHTMSRIIALLEKCRDLIQNDDAAAHMLTEASDYARDGLQEIRRSILGLVPERLESDNLENALNELFWGFKASGISIDFTMQGKFAGSLKLSDAIYKICQEAISNAVRHGNALNVTVVLRIENILKLFICDDGRGCESYKKGFGISSMEQRVKELGGQLDFGSLEGKGFQIYVRIPMR